MNRPFVHRSLRLNLAATAVALLIAVPVFGDITIINDTFDAATVGSTPAGWTFGDGFYGPSTSLRYVTNNISIPPSSPNVLQFDTPEGSYGGDAARAFASTSLITDRPLDIGYSFRVDRLDHTYSGYEFVVMTANGSQEPFGISRLSGGPATYNFTNPIQTPNYATGLSTGDWHRFVLSIDLTNAASLTGFANWSLDNVLIRNEAFTLPSGFYTNIASVVLFDWAAGAGGGGELLYLDNLEISQEVPEPSTVLLLGAGVWLFWRARNGRVA